MRKADDLYSPEEAANQAAAMRSATTTLGDSENPAAATAVVTITPWRKLWQPKPKPAKQLPSYYMPDAEESVLLTVRRSMVLKVIFVVAILMLAAGVAVGLVWVVHLKGSPPPSPSFQNASDPSNPECGDGCPDGPGTAPGTVASPPKGGKYNDPLPSSPDVDNVGNDTVQITNDGRLGPVNPIDDSLFDIQYDDALGKVFLFYEAQRSGALPADYRINWRGDSTQTDGAEINEDLEGGWFEAGNRLKITFPTAYSLAQMAWGCAYYRPTYESLKFQGETVLYWCMREIKWGAKYLMKTHLRNPDGTTRQVVAQVGDRDADFDYYGRVENMTMPRPVLVADGATTPATEVGAQLAASLAAASYLFKDDDPEFSSQCLDNAKAVYWWSNKYLGLFSNSSASYSLLYSTQQYEMHQFYAASMLYFATKCDPDQTGCDQQGALTYYNDALNLWALPKVSERCYFPVANWDNPCFDAALLLVQATGQTDSVFTSYLSQFVESNIAPDPINGLIITPKGLRMHPDSLWAALRNAANSAHISLMFADLPGLSPDLALKARCYARSQIGYILGDTGFSYMVGFKKNYPQQPHHRDASCTFAESDQGLCRDGAGGMWVADRPNPNVITGALVGGPDEQDVFQDKRKLYEFTEVALDYNAALTTALAGLAGLPQEFWQNIQGCYTLITNYPWQ